MELAITFINENLAILANDLNSRTSNYSYSIYFNLLLLLTIHLVSS